MSIKHRNYGIDLIKIVACILVITLHCLPPTNSVVKNSIFNSGLYYAGTLAIPVFFMASSYFVLNKQTISYLYSFNRIKNILFVIISWVLLYSLAQFIIKHNFTFIQQLEGSAFTEVSQHNFYHFWFFWELIIMLLLAPLMWWLLQKHFIVYIILTIAVICICLSVDILLHLGFSTTIQYIPQVFRFYLYIAYYLIGGIIGNLRFKRILDYISTYFLFFMMLDIVLYVAVIAYSLWNKNIINWPYAEANYGNILVIITSSLSFCLFTISTPKFQSIIEFLIPFTMGIYMLHPFLIGKLSKLALFSYYPSLMIIAVFVICLIITYLALKIPVISKLFKL
ncbi:surface polysaccharide O-acyltransferase-like enzyme [Lactobacillus colini]|uniref:Surface polysaccharide O-acyltransferase-like enzyme n=1 Tax=Lactobacillus colini TaxID=1819254 RepID=A0ABS4MEJ5_9LACO|nr:acyltransferase [Lactobacillus colini]MBP2058100.1 surface polysaccharide O-acyltransferase-like enzyme [Lactobacillus colini]